ncbi:hypothetical protein KSF78_0005088 [Schistosoma japonicum]|nr:hypothetical protein KSF78_0005088 [Schistosoma japonicum]KAH8876935.1 hypothetical protein KSF78_0005088 [Schistosoma japonicum]
MSDPAVVDGQRPRRLKLLGLLVKSNPFIAIGFVATGAILARCCFAKGAELQRLLILRPLCQTFTFSMLLYSMYKLDPTHFTNNFFGSQK